MTGLRWVRLDNSFATNHKILRLLHDNHHRAALAYVCSLTYSGAQGTDGWIPAYALPHIHCRPIDATHLVNVGLWHPNGGDGWHIHDWHNYQPRTAEEVQSQAKRAANIRWHGTPHP